MTSKERSIPFIPRGRGRKRSQENLEDTDYISDIH